MSQAYYNNEFLMTRIELNSVQIHFSHARNDFLWMPGKTKRKINFTATAEERLCSKTIFADQLS